MSAVTSSFVATALVWKVVDERPARDGHAWHAITRVLSIQRFVGSADSDYGRFANLLHAEVCWVF